MAFSTQTYKVVEDFQKDHVIVDLKVYGSSVIFRLRK